MQMTPATLEEEIYTELMSLVWCPQKHESGTDRIDLETYAHEPRELEHVFVVRGKLTPRPVQRDIMLHRVQKTYVDKAKPLRQVIDIVAKTLCT